MMSFSIATFFLTHWFQFNYAMPHEVWYRAADWPNVFVMLPIAILGFLYIRSRQYAEKLDKLLDKLDPNTDGGLSDIRDALDPTTPSGIGVIIQKMESKSKKT